MILRAFTCIASSRESCMICTALRMGASGLRSSCASVARNSSLRRSASRSVASVRLRCVTSAMMPRKRRRVGSCSLARAET